MEDYESFIIVTSNASTVIKNVDGYNTNLIVYLNAYAGDIGVSPTYDLYYGYRAVEIDHTTGGIKFYKSGYRKPETTTVVKTYYTGIVPKIIYGILNE